MYFKTGTLFNFKPQNTMKILLSSSQTIKNQLNNMEQDLVLLFRKNPTNLNIFSLLKTRKGNELRGTRDVYMKVVWILYCEAPAVQTGDSMSCCPGRAVLAGSWEGSVPAPYPWAIPGTRAELAAWLFAC